GHRSPTMESAHAQSEVCRSPSAGVRLESRVRTANRLRPTDDVPKQSDDVKFKWKDIVDYVAPPILRVLQYGSTDPRMITARRYLADLIAHAAKKKRKEKPAE